MKAKLLELKQHIVAEINEKMVASYCQKHVPKINRSVNPLRFCQCVRSWSTTSKSRSTKRWTPNTWDVERGKRRSFRKEKVYETCILNTCGPWKRATREWCRSLVYDWLCETCTCVKNVKGIKYPRTRVSKVCARLRDSTNEWNLPCHIE